MYIYIYIYIFARKNRVRSGGSLSYRRDLPSIVPGEARQLSRCFRSPPLGPVKPASSADFPEGQPEGHEAKLGFLDVPYVFLRVCALGLA